MDPLNFLTKVESETFSDARGVLNAIELPEELNFETKRIYYITEVPVNSIRGTHAHKKLRQIFFALSGSFTLIVTDGQRTDKVRISAHSSGYYLPSGYWRELTEFEPETICLVLASEHFNDSDYIKEKNTYLEWRSQNEN
jgi:dTDP-4-dehydrorhamnose 3,5-epimerase-like enzyme